MGGEKENDSVAAPDNKLFHLNKRLYLKRQAITLIQCQTDQGSHWDFENRSPRDMF